MRTQTQGLRRVMAASAATQFETLEQRMLMDSAWADSYTPAFVGPDRPGVTVAADLDRDGDLDLVVWQRPRLVYLMNDGEGSFVQAGQVAIKGNPEMLAAGDFDGDTHQDVAALGTIGNRRVVHIYQNDRHGELVKRSRQPVNAYWLTFVDAQAPSVEDQIVLLEYPSHAMLTLNRVHGGRLEQVRPLVVSLGSIAPPAKVDFDGDGLDDALLVGVNDRSTASLLEVGLATPSERQVFQTTGSTIAQVWVRGAQDADAEGPGIAIRTTQFTGRVETHVLTIDLPSGPGMTYEVPQSIYFDFDSSSSDGIQTGGREVELEIAGLSDVDDDGRIDVLVKNSWYTYTGGRYNIILDRYSSLITLSRDDMDQWATSHRDIDEQRILPRRDYLLEDLNGDGLPDLIRIRGGQYSRPAPLRVAVALNVPNE